jgi:hypothetical protein
MTPRFQADEDFNQRIVLGLRRREAAIDFRDAHDGRVIGASDATVLRLAAESGRILISHDRKTMPAHLARFLESYSIPGVIIVSQGLDVATAIEDLLIIWAASDAEMAEPTWFCAVVDTSHFRPIPILGKRSQPATQIGRLRLVDPSFAKIDRLDHMFSIPRRAPLSPGQP